MKAGDIVLFNGPNFFSRLIRFGQKLYLKNEMEPFAYWNHVAVVVGVEDGQPVIVEAVSNVRMGKLWDLYNSEEYVVKIVDTGRISEEDVKQVVDFAVSQVGHKYDWVQILSMAAKCLFRGKFSFGIEGSHICSGLAATSLERAGFTFEREADTLMPADLAAYFRIYP